MAAKRSRTRAHRRDRRKAKASNWRRDGKQGMGSRVGHGSGNNAGHVGTLKPEQKPEQLTFKQRVKEEIAKLKRLTNVRGPSPLRVTLGELISRKK